MQDESVVGVYPSMADAEAAVRTLDRSGVSIKNVSIIARGLETEREIQGFVTTGDVARTGAATGAWAGGIFGLLLGAAFLWVPVVGPIVVAGPLAAALVGALEGGAIGAAGGGLLGSLVGWGVSRDDVLKYEDYLRGGKYLVVVHGSAEDVARAHGLLSKTTHVADLAVHRRTARAA